MTALPRLTAGHLPQGRWACSEVEVHGAYVAGRPGDREAIWQEWQQVTSALRSVVGEVAACWLSGSFFTDKPSPADIDCVYVVDTARLSAAASSNQQHAAFLQLVNTSGVKQAFGVRVDTYILEWMPSPGSQPAVGTGSYLQSRGYWDDLWCRLKDADLRLGSIPRRGYLEVHLDGYK